MLSMITMVGAADFSGGESLNVYTAKGAEGLSYEAAVAYKGVINDMHKEYGDYQGYDDSWEMAETGLGLAMLIDFDHNGTLELLIGCGTINPDEDRLFYEVYGYENGLVKYTHQYCCGSMDLCFDLHFGDNGKNVYTITPAGSDTVCDGSSFYGTLLNGKWEVTEYYSHEAGFCDGEWCGLAGKDVYRINGIDVSYEKWVDRACDIEEEYGPESYDDVERDYYTFGKKGIERVIETLDAVIGSKEQPQQSYNLTMDFVETLNQHEGLVIEGYGVIRAYRNGEKIWEYKTEKTSMRGDICAISDVFTNGDSVYIVVNNKLLALDTNDGHLKWHVNHVGTDNKIAFDDYGNIYISSFYQPDLVVINKFGKELYRDEKDYYGGVDELKITDNHLNIHYWHSDDGEGIIQLDISQFIPNEITVLLDGKKLIFDQSPIIVDGRTLVPLRAIFEELGATVHWDGNTQTVTSTKGQTTISMSIGKTEMYKNGKSITLDVVPQLVGDRTLVPVRAVAEAFDCKVDWDGETRTVIIKQ